MNRAAISGKLWGMLGVLTLGLLSSAGAGAAGVNVTVMDQAVDLSHVRLMKFLNINKLELNGKPDFDDDRNSFVDDIMGWNAVSNDAHYMPAGVIKVFREQRAGIRQVIDLYNRVEQGDAEAIRFFRDHADIASAASAVLEYSHGTHVAGIVALNSSGSARLQNLNIMSPSSGGIAHSSISSARAPSLSAIRSSFVASFSAVAQGLSQGEVKASARSSLFDSREWIDQALASVKVVAQKESLLYTAYLAANRSSVVNLSVGESLFSIVQLVDGVWKKELTDRGLSPDTARNSVQDENFQYAILSIWKAHSKQWQDLFSALPNTLFVIAACNDGKDLVDYPTLPAQLSVFNRNVIVVAATDLEGLITDFSNFNSKIVSLGAWGKAVPSYAPSDLEDVLMSGTSMAAPMVSGVASAIREVNPRLSAADVREILEGTVKSVGSLTGKTLTGGMLDPAIALDAARRSTANRVEDAIRMARYSSDTPISPFRNWTGGLRGVLPLGLDGTEGKVSPTSDIVKSLMPRF